MNSSHLKLCANICSRSIANNKSKPCDIFMYLHMVIIIIHNNKDTFIFFAIHYNARKISITFTSSCARANLYYFVKCMFYICVYATHAEHNLVYLYSNLSVECARIKALYFVNQPASASASMYKHIF